MYSPSTRGTQMHIEANRSYVAAVGTTEEIIDIFFGPQNHNEHCKGWRFHLYMSDMSKRDAAVRAEVRKMLAERRAREDAISLLEAA